MRAVKWYTSGLSSCLGGGGGEGIDTRTGTGEGEVVTLCDLFGS